MADNLIPVSTTGCPMFDNIFRHEIQQFAQRIIIRKGRLVLCDFPKLPVEPFNNVGRIYDFPDFGRICVKGGKDIPVVGVKISDSMVRYRQ